MIQNMLALRNRYVFTGELEMLTALHIGGGKATLSHTDSPVVLTHEDLPYIPGSSFKGVFRSTIEKLVASLPDDLGLHTCGLPTQETPDEPCPTARPNQLAELGRDPARLASERERLCHTCQLFGSPLAAARIILNDLYLVNDEWSGTTQIRDGVAIDRDSETAKPKLKYDFEVVPSTSVFALHIVLENATSQDLQLMSIGLNEFRNGFGGVGGLRSRGLGACVLNNLRISCLDLEDERERKQRLQRYLLRKEMETLDTETFLEQQINALFAGSASNL